MKLFAAFYDHALSTHRHLDYLTSKSTNDVTSINDVITDQRRHDIFDDQRRHDIIHDVMIKVWCREEVYSIHLYGRDQLKRLVKWSVLPELIPSPDFDNRRQKLLHSGNCGIYSRPVLAACTHIGNWHILPRPAGWVMFGRDVHVHSRFQLVIVHFIP